MESRLRDISQFIEKVTKLPEGINFAKYSNGTIIFENPYDVKDDDSTFLIYLNKYVDGNDGLPEIMKYGISFTKYEPVRSILIKLNESIEDFQEKLPR